MEIVVFVMFAMFAALVWVLVFSTAAFFIWIWEVIKMWRSLGDK